MAELPRVLAPLNAVAMVAGTIIGASIFVQPSEIARHLETPAQIMIVWLACGVLTLLGALVCAELSSAFPETGGLYVFLRDTFSPLAGFLWAWAMFWTMHSGIIAAIAVVFARYTAFFIPLSEAGYAPPYRTWGYPVVPVVFIVATPRPFDWRSTSPDPIAFWPAVITRIRLAASRSCSTRSRLCPSTTG